MDTYRYDLILLRNKGVFEKGRGSRAPHLTGRKKFVLIFLKLPHKYGLLKIVFEIFKKKKKPYKLYLISNVHFSF